MIDRFRRHYKRSLAEAEAALALTDDELAVRTYLGLYAMRNIEEVTE